MINKWVDNCFINKRVQSVHQSNNVIMEYEYFKTVQLIMNRVFFSSNKMKYPLYDLIDYHTLKTKIMYLET